MQMGATRPHIEAKGGRMPLENLLRYIKAVGGILARRVASELSQDAFNRRVLYRASVMTPAELAANGLSERDVAEAYAASDPASFLLARRSAGRAASDNRSAA